LRPRSIDDLKRDILMLQKNQEEVMLRLRNLEQELQRLEAHVDDATETAGERPTVAPAVEATPLPAMLAKQEDPAADQPTRNWEAKIGGTWLNRIGVVAVILGLAYFLKYSFDNAWIGPIGRITLGIISGLAMLGGGEKLRAKYPGYAQGLLGGGSLALFFAIYAGYDFYELFSSSIAFPLMILVMVLTVAMAVRHHSLPIGVLGILGGYAIPFLVGDSDGSLWAYYGYYTLLTAGVLAVSLYRKWPMFRYLSFLFGHLALWISLLDGLFGSFMHQVPALLYAIMLFVFYLAVISLYHIRRKTVSTAGDFSLLVLNGLLFFGESALLLSDLYGDDYLGFYAVVLGLLYVYIGKLAYKVNPPDRLQTYGLFLISFVMVTIAIPLQLSGQYIAIAWLAEAAGLAYVSSRLQVPSIRYGALAVLALGTLIGLGELSELEYEDVFLWNIPSMLMLFVLISFAAVSRLMQAHRKTRLTLHVLGLVLLFVTLSLENHHYFTLIETEFFLSPEQISLSMIWLLFAIALFAVGLRRQNRYYRYAALGLLALVLLKAFFIDLAELATIYKILLFMILGLILLAISFVYQKKKDLL